MSHVTEMSCDVNPKYIDDFIKALKEHFGEDGVEVDLTTPISMKRYNNRTLHSDDGSFGSAPKCNIVVRKETQCKKLGRNALVNDLGYTVKDGKLTGYVDVAGFSKENQDLVMQNYATFVAIKPLKLQGYAVKETRKNGLVTLKASKYL